LTIENCLLKIEESEVNEDNQSSIVTLQFSISDTGFGMAPEELEHLFEAFVQTRTGLAIREGTGLGLLISRKFVQLMGGDITVESEPGRGTTMTFDIHAGVVKTADIGAKQPARHAVALEPNQSCFRILVVDDKQDNRQVLVKLLSTISASDSGFELREAENGQEAIALWKDWKPQAIFMDMRMPVLDGYEATRRIRAAEAARAEGEHSASENTEYHTAIIALTASAFEENRTKVLETGCDDFIRKPFREAEIFEMLHEYIGVQFVYEEEQQSSIFQPVSGQASIRQSSIEDVLTPEALAALPEEWQATLTQGAEETDVKMLRTVIRQIRERDGAVADALASLIDDFEYDEILRNLQTK